MRNYDDIDGIKENLVTLAIDAFNEGYDQGAKDSGSYDDGYTTGKNEGYEKGVRDAWETAKKLFNTNYNSQLTAMGFPIIDDDWMLTIQGIFNQDPLRVVDKIKRADEWQNKLYDEVVFVGMKWNCPIEDVLRIVKERWEKKDADSR